MSAAYREFRLGRKQHPLHVISGVETSNLRHGSMESQTIDEFVLVSPCAAG